VYSFTQQTILNKKSENDEDKVKVITNNFYYNYLLKATRLDMQETSNFAPLFVSDPIKIINDYNSGKLLCLINQLD
jgi:hypothetical protein